MADVETGGTSGVVHETLEACSNEELAPLVDLLVATPLGALGISRAYELHRPDHRRYADRIGDEIHRLARVATLRADLLRPSYREMASALLKQIGIPPTPTLEGDEALLLNLFCPRHPSFVQESDRERLVGEAAAAAGAAAKGMLSSDAWPVLAALLVRIADLRTRRAGTTSSSIPSLPGPTAALPAAVGEEPDGFVLRTDDGGTVLSLAAVEQGGEARWRELRDGGELPRLLSPVLEAVRPLLTTEHMAKAAGYMRVTLPPGAKLDRIPDTSAFYGSARAGGRFCPIRLDPASIALLATPAALLTLASAIADQKRQESIERDLAEIKAGLADVSRFQTEERRSVLTGSIRYFRQIAPSVLAGERSAEVLQVIEDHESDLLQVQDHLVDDLRRQIEALRSLRNGGWGSSRFLKEVEEAEAAIARGCEEALLCLRARACGYQLLDAFPGREAGKRARLDDVSQGLDLFSPSGEIAAAIDGALREKVALAPSWDAKSRLLALEDQLLARLAGERAAIGRGLRAAGPSDDRPLAFDLRVEDGVPVALRLG